MQPITIPTASSISIAKNATAVKIMTYYNSLWHHHDGLGHWPIERLYRQEVKHSNTHQVVNIRSVIGAGVTLSEHPNASCIKHHRHFLCPRAALLHLPCWRLNGVSVQVHDGPCAAAVCFSHWCTADWQHIFPLTTIQLKRPFRITETQDTVYNSCIFVLQRLMDPEGLDAAPMV